MILYNGKVCLTVDELTQGDQPIVKRNTLKSWLRRGKASYARKAYGEGVCALIEYNSLPARIRSMVDEQIGDPKYLKIPSSSITLKEDTEARIYYTYKYSYLKGDIKTHLPDYLVEEYTLNASVLNYLIHRYGQLRSMTNKLNNSRSDIWQIITAESEQLKGDYGHTLPSSTNRLRKRFNEYKRKGYKCLISGKIGNANTIKITPEAGEYLIALKRQRLPEVLTNQRILEQYNCEASANGWQEIESLQTLRNYLYSSAIKPLWYEAVHGPVKLNSVYGHKMHTKLPSVRDALWYGDGTKLNIYYQDEFGNVTTTDVYEVIDAYSECLLGFGIGKEERSETQYEAYRSAVMFAQSKCYELVVDNQSGHKKLERQQFLNKICHHLHYTTPYRSQAKTIESLFGRFQKQVLSRSPFFTGQNITAKGEESRPNMEWIYANRHLLPTYSELQELYSQMREKWNNAIHPTTGISRIEMYRKSKNEALSELTTEDMVEMFWLDHTKPITFTTSGIKITVNKEQRLYDVYDNDGHVDHTWKLRNIGEKFAIKYDPQDDTSICLYRIDSDGSKRFERFARPAVVVKRSLQEQDSVDKALIYTTLKRDLQARQEIISEGRAIDIKYGNNGNDLRVPGMSASENAEIDKMTREKAYGNILQRVDAQKMRQKRVDISVAKLQKKLSKSDFFDVLREKKDVSIESKLQAKL